MKIYNLTFNLNNYGTVLQLFALHKKIKELGGSPELLVFKEPKGIKVYWERLINFFIPQKHYSYLKKIQKFLNEKKYGLKNAKLLEFKKKNIAIKYLTPKNIETLDDIGCFLVGSDQLWNIVDHPIKSDYSLDFVPHTITARKYSYAVSIGLDELNQKQYDYYRQTLSGFHTISIREKQGYTLLKNVFGNIRNDVDPTLLFDGIFWNDLTLVQPQKSKYIFVYMLRPDDKLIRIAQKVATENNLKIEYIGLLARKEKNIHSIYDAGIEEFLTLIKNAEFVVTNSFHATLFSILFEKKFINIKIASTSSRAENILNITNLQEKLICDEKDFVALYKTYDFVNAKARIASEREKSIEYLKQIVDYVNSRSK